MLDKSTIAALIEFRLQSCRDLRHGDDNLGRMRLFFKQGIVEAD